MKSATTLSITGIPTEYLRVLLERMGADIDLKESAKDDLYGKIDDLDAEIKSLKASFDSIEGEIENRKHSAETVTVQGLPTTPTGRAKRGASGDVVKDFLKQKNGTGASIIEITAATGTKYGTVRRILHILKDKSLAHQTNDSRWHLASTPTQNANIDDF